MGLGGRKHFLPAATDSLVESAAEDNGFASEDIGTDISQRTHHTIPDDGSPITIATNKVRGKNSKGNHSQTSLLIEYWEAGKDPENTGRPSVRVKVTPSSRKTGSNDTRDETTPTADATGTRKPTYTRRISLGSRNHARGVSASDVSDLDRTALDHNADPRHSDVSEMSASPEARYIPASSDISSMPADSMLGAPLSTLPPTHRHVEESTLSSLPAEGSVLSEQDVAQATTLRPPVFPKERNLSNERIASKVIEKLSAKPRVSTSSHRRSEKSSSRSLGRDLENTSSTRQHVAAKQFRDEDSELSRSDPSVLSPSALSAGAKSLGEHSNRSGVSTASITNPKLLQTVEDVVRRLILPELKELKKDQKHSHRSKYDSYSDISETSVAREKASRRSTSGSKSRRRSSRESTEGSGSRRRKSSHSHAHRDRDVDYDSLSDTSSRRHESLSSISLEDHKVSRRRDKDHHVRDMAAAGLLGAGLTAAALHEKDSEDSTQRRRRRKRSKSHSSRSASVTESDEIFHKHQVPPMPLQSEVGTDLTRSSILSSNTAGTATPVQREVREVVRGSPRDALSPAPNNAARLSGDLRQVLGTHHDNFSEHNLSAQRLAAFDEQEDRDAVSPETERYDPYYDELLEDPERMKQYERNLHTQHPIRRGLSPIQSVASYATTEPNRTSMMHAKSYDSIASIKRRQQQLKEEVSIGSFASASPDYRKQRPHGINLENRSEIMGQHNSPLKSPGFARGLDYSSDEHEIYRDSYQTNADTLDNKHLSGYTEDTASDLQYVDKVTAGQNVAKVVGAVPEYVHTPPGVESAVASLIEPSLLDVQGSQLSQDSTFDRRANRSSQSLPREVESMRRISPLKQQPAASSQSSLVKQRAVVSSPPQSPARSFEPEPEPEQLRVHTQPDSPAVNVQQEIDKSPESEIITNPSIIRGPMGGANASNLEDWGRQAATPPHSGQTAYSRDFTPGATDLIPEGLNVNQRPNIETKPGTYIIGQPIPTPPGNKDEGYVTGDNYPSPGPMIAEAPRALPDLDYNGGLDDPFVTKNKQYMSGLSQGMSPLYDSAKGRGMDRIQSQDIVALMNHLTVRDAQRNARDREILTHLVRSAAEMRNSFEEMRMFISEQDQFILQEGEKQHEQTRALGGPRPQPPSTRSAQRTAASEEDMPTKRKNIFKRALAGLGSKNTAELQNIEGMLMQLLDEVEVLRGQQGIPAAVPSAGAPLQAVRRSSGGSGDQARAATDSGYEPDGRAGTSSTLDQSGWYSTNSSKQGRQSAVRQMAANRVSTVVEGDEEYDDYDGRDVPTPRAESPAGVDYQNRTRGQSEPLETPPQMPQKGSGALSNENTPKTLSFNTSAERKHKSFASSFMPKMISRWSKTTASTMPDTPNYRASHQAGARPYSQVSRSGSDLHEYQYEVGPGDHLPSLQDEGDYRNENRPPSPLVPSTLSADHPKYEGYRNSINLQHPQPRQGPTGRYQYTLENAAQSYHNSEDAFSPASQVSYMNRPWQTAEPLSSHPLNPQPQQYRGQGPLNTTSSRPDADGDDYSEISDDLAYGPPYNPTSSKRGAPQRPPKIPNDEPLVPQRPPKVPMSPSTYVDHVAAARAGSPAFDKSPIAAIRSGASPQVGRRPSGPRAMGTQSPNAGNVTGGKKARFNNSPLQVDSEGEQY